MIWRTRIGTLGSLFLFIGCGAASDGARHVPESSPTSISSGQPDSHDSPPTPAKPESHPEALPVAKLERAVAPYGIPSPSGGPVAAGISQSYQQILGDTQLSTEELLQSLPPAATPHRLPFELSQSRYFDRFVERVPLNENQLQRLQETGFIAVQASSRHSMADVYRQVWEAELPAIVTTDSILHAWHRSYDEALKQAEQDRFSVAYDELLKGVHGQLAALQLKGSFSEQLLPAATDLDIYLTVARTLLASFGQRHPAEQTAQRDPVAPILASEAARDALLAAITDERMSTVTLYGNQVDIDFAQFQPRGHYTRDSALRQYFRALMWMGRADTGFPLLTANGETSLRGSRSALLFTLLARWSGKLPAFYQAQKSIDYAVGADNGLSLRHVADLLGKRGVTLSQLDSDDEVRKLGRALLMRDPGDRLASHVHVAKSDPEQVDVVFQLSSQRFTIDSFVHDQLSHDRLESRRFMVSPLDIPAALGNPEAVRLLEPQLDKYAFGSELGALRRTVEELPPSYWQGSLYAQWLNVLRSLDEPVDSKHVSPLFDGRAWQRKQLQTQLASWAELRRDTILYVAQGTAHARCEFPDVYVEPYPEFYKRMEAMARRASKHLGNKAFFRRFGDIMRVLARVARAQKSGAAISRSDERFLEEMVKVKTVFDGCSSENVWSGWYAELFLDGDVGKFEPVLADVFMNPLRQEVLNVGTTGAEVGIIAVRTRRGPTLFLGPISGFRSFTGGRMNDRQWRRLITDSPPAAPSWTEGFRAGTIAPISPHPEKDKD